MLKCVKAATREGMAAIKAHMPKITATDIQFPEWVKIDRYVDIEEEGVWIREIREQYSQISAKGKYIPHGYLRKSKLMDLVSKWTGPQEDKTFWEEVKRIYELVIRRKESGCAPKWLIPPPLVEVLMDMGIDQEVCGSPLDSSVHVDRIWGSMAAEQEYPMFGMKRKTAMIMPGGTMGRAIYRPDSIETMRKIRSDLVAMERKGIKARYALVLAVPYGMEQTCEDSIRATEGKIVTKWKRETLEMLPGDWNYGKWTHAQMQACGRKYNTIGEAIWIVLWQNNEAARAWSIGREGWLKFAEFAAKHTTCSPPLLGEDTAVPRNAEQRMKKSIKSRSRGEIKPDPMEDSIVHHGRWEWFQNGIDRSGIEGFWLATRLTPFDPRRKQEISEYKEKLRMPPPQEEEYVTVMGNGQPTVVTDKYWQNKRAQKKEIRKIRREYEQVSGQTERDSIRLILAVGRRVFMATRRMERRKRWEETRELKSKVSQKPSLASSQPLRKVNVAEKAGAKVLQVDQHGQVIGEKKVDAQNARWPGAKAYRSGSTNANKQVRPAQSQGQAHSLHRLNIDNVTLINTDRGQPSGGPTSSTSFNIHNTSGDQGRQGGDRRTIPEQARADRNVNKTREDYERSDRARKRKRGDPPVGQNKTQAWQASEYAVYGASGCQNQLQGRVSQTKAGRGTQAARRHTLSSKSIDNSSQTGQDHHNRAQRRVTPASQRIADNAGANKASDVDHGTHACVPMRKRKRGHDIDNTMNP